MFVSVFANVGFHLPLAATVEQAVSEMQRDGSGVLPVAAAVRGNGDGMSFSSRCFFCSPALLVTGLIRPSLEQKLFYVCCSCGTIFQ